MIDPLRVVIVIPTFRRPELLATLLRGISEQRVEGAVCVAVLDNDASRSAETTVERFRSTYPFDLTYHVVADPGLSAVRNRALDLAREGYAYLAMIDDDECPEPQWLAELLATQRTTGAVAVVGPVPPILPVSAPRWVRELRAREVPDFPDCTFVHEGWSGNCLLDMNAIGRLGVTFDRALDFAGGEDQLFFRQIVARGGRIAYAARAVAWEDTPARRQTFRFAVERSFRRGNSLAFCDRRIYGSKRATVIRFLKGMATIVRGILRTVVAGARRDVGGAVFGACDGVAGVGMLCGLAGMTYQAYRRPVAKASPRPC